MTSSPCSPEALQQLARRLSGELHLDATMRQLYATDASEYQEMPLAVALPKSEADLRELVSFAHQHHVQRNRAPPRPGRTTSVSQNARDFFRNEELRANAATFARCNCLTTC